jgi:hypothetical protein
MSMPERSRRDAPETYEVSPGPPAALSDGEREACVAIVAQGGAVNLKSAKEKLVLASVLAVARMGGTIVGVGAIKRIRTGYAARIAVRSGFDFAPETPELGYVAVDSGHRGHKLSHRIVAELLESHDGPLFATTSNPAMKKTLGDAGFVRKGLEWEGDSGRLSLWIRA